MPTVACIVSAVVSFPERGFSALVVLVTALVAPLGAAATIGKPFFSRASLMKPLSQALNADAPPIMGPCGRRLKESS